MATYGKQYFLSQRYLRACEMMSIDPFRNPNYEKELKDAGLWRPKRRVRSKGG